MIILITPNVIKYVFNFNNITAITVWCISILIINKMSIKKDKRFKVVVRKLPIRDYTEADFEESVAKACDQVQCSKDDMYAAHFVPGKMSRKR